MGCVYPLKRHKTGAYFALTGALLHTQAGIPFAFFPQIAR